MPALFNIPLGANFLEVLCGFIRKEAPSPEESLVLLPTRRAARAFKEVWLETGPAREASFLPEVRPLGDIDEDDNAFLEYGESSDEPSLPPEIGPLERALLLSAMIRAKGPAGFKDSYALALDLIRLQDMVEMEELSFDRLENLVPADYSDYWQETLKFLSILTESYPKILAERGFMNPVARKVELISRRIREWTAAPPERYIFAAGSTGSLVPIRRLLRCVAELPRGRVILPALDRLMDDEAFDSVGQNHPQFGLKTLLDFMGAKRGDAADLCASPRPERARLASLVMSEGDRTAAWRDANLAPAALEGASRLDCRDRLEESLAVSVALRDAVEKGLTARLVTPDRTLAKLVSFRLGRWGLAADDSAGIGASECDCGNYFALVANAAAEDFGPFALLSILKNALTRPDIAAASAEIEASVLRGRREVRGLDDMIATARREDAPAAAAALAKIKSAARPLALSGAPAPLANLLENHIRAVEALAAPRLYSGDFGAQTSERLRGLLRESRALEGDPISLVDPKDYPGFICEWLLSQNLRPKHDNEARVSILNSMEARLLPSDFVILAGLNEGDFPRETADDMWLSRPMRANFGLPLPERKIGLASHDFAEFFCAPKVLLTRAARTDSLVRIPSRWLQKLEALSEISGIKPDETYARYIRNVVENLDRAPQTKLPRPAPRPPASARPKSLSVTWIEKLYRDPYMVYAAKILGLKPLDPIDPPPGAGDFGNVVHAALEEAVRAGRKTAPEIYGALMRAAIGYKDTDSIAFWRARFKRIAAFVAACESSSDAARTYVEADGALEAAPGFTLTARADRIDLDSAGLATIIDYKTGAAPKSNEVEQGYAPQLPLEALILAAGAFRNLPPARAKELRYVSLGALEIQSFPLADGDLLERTRAALLRAIEHFESPAAPYLSRPNPSKVGRALEEYSDYNHLARVDEWNR